MARVVSVRFRSITPAAGRRLGAGRVRLIAAVSKTARVLSPPGFESQALLHHESSSARKFMCAAVAQRRSAWLPTRGSRVRLLPAASFDRCPRNSKSRVRFLKPRDAGANPTGGTTRVRSSSRAEQLLRTQKAGSSTLPGSTSMGLSSSGRIPRFQRAGRRFESGPALTVAVRGAEAAPGSHKPREPGSIPGHATKVRVSRG